MDAILERASVRQFSEEPVSEDQIRVLLRAGMAAPSAGNQQPWEFYVVFDEATRQSLAECSPYVRPAEFAPCVIVACTRESALRFPPCVPQDMGACLENILLEAVEQDLGGVWLGIAPEEDRMDKVAKVLQLPEDVRAFALVAVGHPLKEPNPRGAERYDEERIHWVM